MALKHSFEATGNFLFKYRGQIPVFIFLIGLPFLYFADYNYFTTDLWVEPVLAVVGVCVSLAGIIIRSYTIGTTPKGTSGRNTQKQIAESLNAKGIYSIVRHPLYVGNYLMWAGLLIFAGNAAYFLVASLIYWLYYERIMYAEERFLERTFGQSFIDWSMYVPAFIPAFSKFEKGEMRFSFKAVLRREYSGFFAVALCFMVVDLLRYYVIYNAINCMRISVFAAVFFLIAMLVLRTLKHHTKLLNDSVRRD
ncbi:MAG: isoprenylcysteine carboxylmethyltransferase family protein [Lentimicrobiaceae bacterium]|nr:isoprenylcysteine carboxylmethyltransferase family protein [Lentimicrobiaceae bacterium]